MYVESVCFSIDHKTPQCFHSISESIKLAGEKKSINYKTDHVICFEWNSLGDCGNYSTSKNLMKAIYVLPLFLSVSLSLSVCPLFIL